MEVNGTSDMDYFLASHQAELMLDIVSSNLLSFVPVQGNGNVNDLATNGQNVKASPPENRTNSKWSNFTAFDVLLTAGRISLMVYDISDEK